MSLKAKTTHEDLLLYEILRHPVLCGEFINNIDKAEWEDEFEFHDYQKEVLCDFNQFLELTCGRSVGKTLTLVNKINWILINKIFPDNQILYTVPNKVHLEPVWLGLVRSFRSNSLLKYFVEANKGINSSDHRITLINNAELVCRIAGQSGTGANVIGLHVPIIILDEHGYYPFGTWIELQPVFNAFTQGSQMIASGVPTGLRENNVCWYVDQEDSQYTKHRVSAYQNPRFTEEDKQRAIEQYGGESSEDYQHLVLGLHGSPIFAVFDRNLFSISNDPVYKLTVDGVSLRENLQEYVERLSILPHIPKNSGVILGGDLGYSEPSALIVLYIDSRGRIRFHARIQLNKVSYAIQDKFIDLLDTKFKPGIIGIDAGHAGKAVTQRLLDATEFTHKDYHKRLLPVEFSSSILMGFDADGDEIKTKTKPYSVSVLQEYSNNHKLVYSSTDLEMISELERMTYSKTPLGDIVYKTLTPKGGQKGEDHFTSALLCGILAYHQQNESLNFQRKVTRLARPSWFF